MLEVAAEAGVHFSGYCAVYANEGVAALDRWLEGRGVQNIQDINKVLAHGATPWWDVYSGRENIEVIE